MKKTVLILLTLILMSGCSSMIKLKDEYKEGVPLKNGKTPEATEVFDIQEGTEVSEEKIGNKIVYTAINNGKEKTEELPLVLEPIIIPYCDPKPDMNEFFSDPDKASKASFVLNDKTVTISYEEESFDVEYSYVYPEYKLNDDITIDLYTGYDVSDFLTVEEGIEVSSSLDEEAGILTLDLTKGQWSEHIEKEVTIIDSNPYPIVYRGTVNEHGMDISFMVFTIYSDEYAELYSERTGHLSKCYKTAENTYQNSTPASGDAASYRVYTRTFIINGETAKDTSVYSDNGGSVMPNTTKDGTPIVWNYRLEQ